MTLVSKFKQVKKSKLWKAVSGGYIFQALVIALGFANIFIITNFAGIEVLGQHAILVSTVGFMALLVTARSGEGVVKFYGIHVNNPRSRANSIFYGLIFDILSAAVLFIACYFASSFISEKFLRAPSLEPLVIVFSLINVLFFMKGAMSGYIQAKEKFYFYYCIKLADSLMVSVCLLYFSYTNTLDINTVVYAYLIGATTSLLYLFVLFLVVYVKEFGSVLPSYDRELFVNYTKFNLVTFASSALKAGNQNFDNLVVAYFLPAQTVGVFTVIKKVFAPIGFLAGPLQTATYPKLNQFWIDENYSFFKKMIARITQIMSALVLLYITGITLAQEFISEIFAVSEFENLFWIFSLVATYFFFNPLLWWTRNFSNVVNPKLSLYAGLWYTGFQLIFLPVGAHFYGLIGILVALNFLRVFLLLYWFVSFQKTFRSHR